MVPFWLPLKVIYAVAVAVACIVNAVNALQTVAALIAAKIFTPAAKWSPLSFMKLTHEASYLSMGRSFSYPRGQRLSQ